MKCGFTIAELLISLFVVALIATAMVPIVGPKKIKSPNQKFSHGAYECYYDSEGNLKSFLVTDANKNGEHPEVAEGADVCEFRPPMANFYVVDIYGAGGDGAGSKQDTYYEFVSHVAGNEEIEGMDNFAIDMQKAPAVIRDNFGTQKVGYFLRQTKGKDGVTLNYETGEGNGTSNYVEQHNESMNLQGGSGGAGAVCIAQIGLDVNSTVKTSATPQAALTVKTGNNTVFRGHITIAGNGGNAVYSGGTYTSGTNSTTDAKCVAEVGKYNIATCDTATGKEYTEKKDTCYNFRNEDHTSVEAGNKFIYTYPRMDLVLWYGTKGEQGGITHDVYPDFNNKTLRLKPAKRAVDDEGNVTYSELYVIDANGVEKKLQQAKSGAKGELIQGDANPELGIFKLPINARVDTTNKKITIGKFPDQLQDWVLSRVKNNLSFSALNTKSSMGNQNIGVPGSGAYPLVINKEATMSFNLYSIGFKRSYSDVTSENLLKRISDKYRINPDETAECIEAIDKTTMEYNGKNPAQPYCPATQGHGGGIRISW